jgi:hypothetical protein
MFRALQNIYKALILFHFINILWDKYHADNIIYWFTSLFTDLLIYLHTRLSRLSSDLPLLWRVRISSEYRCISWRHSGMLYIVWLENYSGIASRKIIKISHYVLEILKKVWGVLLRPSLPHPSPLGAYRRTVKFELSKQTTFSDWSNIVLINDQ